VYIPVEPVEYRGRTVGLDEVQRCSVETSYWLHGLLAGARPEHWFGEGYPEQEIEQVNAGWLIHPDEREVLYAAALDRFEKTAVWRKTGSGPCEVCGNTYFPERPNANMHLPSDPWDGCWEDGTIDLDACWPEVADTRPWDQ